MLRELATARLTEYRPELGRSLVADAIDGLLGRAQPADVFRKPTSAEREALVESLAKTYGERLAVAVLPDDVNALVTDLARRFVEMGVLRRAELLSTRSSTLERVGLAANELFGGAKPTVFSRITEELEANRHSPAEGTSEGTELGAVRPSRSHRELGCPGRAVEAWTAGGRGFRPSTGSEARMEPRPVRIKNAQLQAIRETLDKPFAQRLLLWKKTKNDLVEEMSTALQMPGWGNSFTQPIAARIEMLSTGVRMPVAVKVFGTNLEDVQAASQEIATVLREIPAPPTCFRIRSWAKAMSRSRSTAPRRPAMASTSATFRTWWRLRSGARP